MKTIFSALLIILFSINLHAQNYKLVSFELVKTFTQEELKEKWKKGKIPLAIAPVNYNVNAYEVIYKTRWHDGTEILASGYYYTPKDIKIPIPSMVMNHGTKLRKEFELKLGGLQIGCIASAADGYAVLFPHYIGLGKGEKTHLYQIANSEAIANVDMLRAVRELNKEIGISSNHQLFITGYSQGGHAALSTHQLIQEKFSNEFTVTASAPMSGAYDMTGVQSAVMYKKYNHQAYLPYLLLSLQEKYKIWDGDIYDVFKEPYKTIIKEKLNSENSLKEVSKLLPEIPAEMILDSIIFEFKNNPEFAFTKALKENNNYDWKPESPVMFCYCNADEQVSYENAFVARDKMKENGAKRILMSNGGKKFDHNTCAAFSLMNTKFFFDSFRNGSKNGNKGKISKRFLVSLAKMAALNKQNKK